MKAGTYAVYLLTDTEHRQFVGEGIATLNEAQSLAEAKLREMPNCSHAYVVTLAAVAEKETAVRWLKR